MKSKLLLPMIKVLRNPACYFYSALRHYSCSNLVNIRQYQKEDIGGIVQLIKKEDFNLSINEVDFAYYLDPQGGYVSTAPTGKILGACILYNVDDEVAGGVAYVVDSQHRGKGIGTPLFRLALEHLSPRNIIGTASPLMAPKYAASGHFFLGEKLHRYGKLPPFNFISKSTDKSFTVVPYSSSLWDKILEYESAICTPVRQKLLKWWINQPSSLACVALKNKTVCGYGVIYEGTNTTRVAPLFADNVNIAHRLLLTLVCEFNVAKERGFGIDISEKNEVGIQMARDINLDLIRIYPFMYKTKNVLSYHPNIYCRTCWQTI